jgi:hypothetical protein
MRPLSRRLFFAAPVALPGAAEAAQVPAAPVVAAVDVQRTGNVIFTPAAEVIRVEDAGRELVCYRHYSHEPFRVLYSLQEVDTGGPPRSGPLHITKIPIPASQRRAA